MTKRSFGTRTMTGLNDWLYRTFVRGRSAAGDLAEFQTGTTFKVYCASEQIGLPKTIPSPSGPKTVRKYGYLVITVGAPITWEILAKTETVTVNLVGPLRSSDGPRVRLMSRLSYYLVATPDGEISVHLPTVDAALVNEAIARAPRPATA